MGTRHRLLATAVAVMLTAGCAQIDAAFRSSIADGSPGGSRMPLDLHDPHRTIYCDEHRVNGGAFVGYSPFAATGHPAEVRQMLCPIKPPPGETAWVLSERIQGTDTLEVWATTPASEASTTGSHWPTPPELALSCSTGTPRRSPEVSIRWMPPPHPLSGAWSGFYSPSWGETPPRVSVTWQASHLEAEALWMPPADASRFISVLRSAPSSPTGTSSARITFEIADTSGDTRTEIDITGWEHALAVLTSSCQP